MGSVTEESQSRWKFMVRAFRSRNYRLFFAGQLVSLIGSWLAQVAMSWLVYELTGSKALLGIVAFSSQIPAFFLTPWAGVLVDRWNLRRTLITTQTLAMCQAFTVAALALTGLIRPTHIILLAIAQGMITAFDMPTRQSFVVKIVDRREDLANAIALNSTMFNASRLLGPAVAGVLISLIGVGPCFLLDGCSYAAVITSLVAIKVIEPVNHRTTKRIWAEFREGFNYVVSSLPIRSLLVQLGLISFLATPYTILLPVFAKDVYGGGPMALGALTSSVGFGALMGGLRLASRRSVLGLGKWLAIGAIMMGVSLVVFSFSSSIYLGALCLACCGFAQITQMAGGNTLLQTIIDDDKRGRVMSFHAMAFMGMMPLGSLLGGSVASTAIGATGTVAAGGVCCILLGSWFATRLPRLREAVRPIYMQRGVLPAPADALTE